MTPGIGHRVSNFIEGLYDGAIDVIALPGYAVDAVNHAPMILNVLPGDQGFSTFSDRPFLGHDMIRDSLKGAHNAYKDAVGVETPQILDGTDQALRVGGELAGGGIVTMGAGTVVGAGAKAATTIARPGAIDILLDTMSGGTRIAKGTRFGSLAAAESAGLSTASPFAASAANMAKVPGALAGKTAGIAGRLLPDNIGTLAAQSAISGAGLTARFAGRTALGTAKFGLRHPVMSAGALATADIAYNNGQGTAALGRKAVETATGLATDAMGLGPMLGNGGRSMGESLRNFGFADIERALNIDIPDEWERRSRKMLRDFATSSFGQWLMSGSAGAKLLLGLVSYILFDGLKDRLVGNDTATNMLSLGVGVAASQMLPDLLKSWLEEAPAPSMEADTRPPQAMDFAPSNGGGATGMSFAPAP